MTIIALSRALPGQRQGRCALLALGAELAHYLDLKPGDDAAVDDHGLVEAVIAGAESVTRLGGAKPGDKTMVDAMTPAVEALEAGVADLPAALEAAAVAAAAGRDSVTPIVARKGRASYLGERSAGHQDPGATSTTILFESLRDALRAG